MRGGHKTKPRRLARARVSAGPRSLGYGPAPKVDHRVCSVTAQNALSLILLRRVSRVDRHDRVTLAKSLQQLLEAVWIVEIGGQPLPRTGHRLLGSLTRLHGVEARPTFQDRHVCVAGGV